VKEKTIVIPASHIIRDPWMTNGLITSSRNLNKLFRKKINKEKSHPHSIKFNKYRNSYNNLKRKAKIKFYNEIFVKYRHDIRKTWGVINSLIGRTNDKTGISETFQINNVPVDDPQTIANEFCNFFTNIGTQYANNIAPSKYSADYLMLIFSP